MDGWFIYRLMLPIGCFSAELRLIQVFKVLRHFQLVHNREANYSASRSHFSQDP